MEYEDNFFVIRVRWLDPILKFRLDSNRITYKIEKVECLNFDRGKVKLESVMLLSLIRVMNKVNIFKI